MVSLCVSGWGRPPITISFTGVVTGVDSPLSGGFSLGALLNGSYTFDPTLAARAARQ